MTSGGRTSKKRAAPSQIGPRPKKALSEKPRARDEKPAAVKRGKPVTLLGTLDSDTGSDEGEDPSEEGDAESTDEDEEMLDAPTKDPNGGCRVYPLAAECKADGPQLQGRDIRPRKFFLISARLQNLTLHCSETLSAYGVLPDKKTLAQSGRNTSPIS